MIRNNLNRKENKRRATLFSKLISSYPTQLIRVTLELIPTTCKSKEMTTSEINFLFVNVLEFSSKLTDEVIGEELTFSFFEENSPEDIFLEPLPRWNEAEFVKTNERA